MAVKFETQSIRTLAYFEKKTNVHARDCIITDDCIYFLVEPEKIGMAIGKSGSIIKDVRKAFGKNVFGLREMMSSLPKPQFKALLSTLREGTPLDPTVADAVAVAGAAWVVAMLRRVWMKPFCSNSFTMASSSAHFGFLLHSSANEIPSPMQNRSWR